MEKKEKPKFISVKGKNPPVSQRKSFKSKFKNKNHGYHKNPKAFIPPKSSGKKTFHHYNHLEGDKNTLFTSNITGAEWAKYSFSRWNKVIDQKAVVLESQVTPLKSLDAGEEVRIIDMRGRIEPQYKILDSSGAYWYLPVTKIKILEQEIN